ncbi:MAG TPA: Ig-like domain-containing protein [Candidatus Saccharimonadales bacterium]|nr:Ig-like domain-containing protein [Candidatus Saccharimonadales bacterium]
MKYRYRKNIQKKFFEVTRSSLASAIGLLLLISGLATWNALATGTPTPVPAANVNGVTVGGGFIEDYARQVVRTSSNTVYVIAADDNPCQIGGSGVIRAYKGSGSQAGNANVPTSFAEVDAADHPVSAGSGTCTFSGGVVDLLESPDLRLDSSGIIHVAYIDGNNGNLYYQTFSTATDSWGSRTVIATGAETTTGTGWPRTGQVALTLDSNDVPFVAYATSGSSNSIKFVDKLGGTWSTPVTVGSGTNEMHPSMVTALDGTIHLAWLDNSLATHSNVKYSKYSAGAWGTVETASSGDASVLANGDDDQGPSIATDLSDRPHVLYLDGTVNGSDNYVRLKYRTAGGTWTDNTPPGSAGGASNPSGNWYTHTPQNYITSAGDEFVFLAHDANISPGPYEYQVGGPGNNWSAVSQLDPRNSTNTTAGAPGLDGSASLRWDPLRDNNPSLIDILYYDENDGTAGYAHHATIYYKAMDISPMIGDSTPPTVSMSAPTDGATVSGSSVAVSATASDNVGVAGVQFKLDGANLGAEDTTAPYAITWDSTTATDASHTLTAVARDAAGNTTTSTAVTVTVNNADSTPPTVGMTAPVDGSTVKGSTVTVSANASDNLAVAGVQFQLDGVNLGAEDTTAPYSITWDSTSAADGTHALTAIARDAGGNTTTSASVSVSVDNTAPTISLTAPTDSTTVSGSAVTLSATASDNIGVVGVQFKLDGANLGAEDTTAPYSLNWDSTTASNGFHSITAVVRDAAGNTVTTAIVTVTSKNSAGGPGDVNNDGHVNITDLSMLLSKYLTTDTVCDINSDGTVNIFDLSILLTHYGT